MVPTLEPWDPLIEAAAHGRTDELRRLVAAGAELDAFHSDGRATALTMATVFDHKEAALYLLQAGADPVAENDRDTSGAPLPESHRLPCMCINGLGKLVRWQREEMTRKPACDTTAE